jgi:NAD(P)-dependent dehydrogenase (short-subunit alcohol dehydrogenase family)
MAALPLERDVIKFVIPKLDQENTMSQKLSGKVALVTGGSSGIGLATAKRFVAEGAYVFITGRRQTELDAAVKEIGKNVTGIQSDVSNLADLDRLYATIEQEQSHLDVVFANRHLRKRCRDSEVAGQNLLSRHIRVALRRHDKGSA